MTGTSAPDRAGEHAARFARVFGASPAVRIDAPGRINLIGEHIDYCGLPVLPAALPRRITLFARGRTDAQVRLVSSPAFGSRQFDLAPEIPPFPSGDWGNYAKAAAQAFTAEFPGPRGFDGLIVSDLPAASGLSSSSALVIAVALALYRFNDVPVEPVRLAERMAQAERYTGTQGGGMDQAACLLAREGCALLMEFEPLRVEPVPVPASWNFVVAFSGTAAAKSGSALVAYNMRRAEALEALGRVRAVLGLGDAGYPELLARVGATDLLACAERSLREPLRPRFRHVVSEAARVQRAREALVAGDTAAFGACMCESHASLRDDYDVSTPDLEALVEIAQGVGAAGARLTGAGLGGSAIALCEGDTLEPVLDQLRAQYFAPRGLSTDYLFAARPAAGARVTVLAG